ncbi:mitochondrial glycine transporter-like isoform X2 [Ischnura elegans]|uniref:mitochondrial glycine transporter-like isoform X2 n=1 Tax=Ischnura elegans TaxID=197161 RepID=UPI001ED86AB2|nr:mitochondrial glycine transporter-like isoform X2 [Ischnura elegans]
MNDSSYESSFAMDLVANYPLVKSFLAGSFSGTFSTIVFQPLDLVKTRLQAPVNTSIGANQTSMITIFGKILEKDHLPGLWKGMTPSIARVIPGVGLYFSSLHWLRSLTSKGNGSEPGPLEAVALGMAARSISGICLIPMTVIKTRFESGVYQYGGVIQAFRTIYRNEGVRGLSCGLLPTLFRDAPFSGLYLMFYTQAKAAVPEDWMDSKANAPIHFSCGIVAGLLASFVTQPADVLKTKMQLYPEKFNGIIDVIFYVHKKYGMKGYFKGLAPRMLRRTLMAAMAWTIYEQVTKSMGLK